VPAVASGKGKYSRGSGVYTGGDVRFLLPSGRYTIELIGTNIDASAVGRGSIIATGLGTFDDGSFAVNGGRPQLLTRGASDDVFGKGAT
jgi:predicted sugar kinase